MENSKKSLFPKDFFIKERNEITSKEALKDVAPLNYSNREEKTTSNFISKEINKISYN